MALELPTMPADAGYPETANWLAGSTENIVEEGNTFIEQLSDLGDIDFNSVGDLPEYTSVLWLAQTSGVLDKPTRPTINTDVQDLLDQLRHLTAPEAPDATFEYTEPGYYSELRNPLIQKILDDLTNGGYGIEDDDEIALFNRERDREIATYTASIEEIRKQHAATSFPVPQAALDVAIRRAQDELNRKLSGINRDIALRRSELYVQNRQFTIEKALASEDQSIALYNAIQNRLLQVAQLEVQMAIALFDSAIRLFVSKIEALQSQVEATMDAARAEVQIYASDVAAYSAFVNAVVAGAQVDIANSRNKLQRDATQHQSRVEIIRFKLAKLGMTVDNAKDIRKYGVDFYRTALGSAMNGINGLAVQSSEV